MRKFALSRFHLFYMFASYSFALCLLCNLQLTTVGFQSQLLQLTENAKSCNDKYIVELSKFFTIKMKKIFYRSEKVKRDIFDIVVTH